MKVVDIADEIFRELAYPSDLSLPAIAFWLRSNIGTLNNVINSTYAVLSSTLEFDTDLTDQEKSIFKKLYNIHYYDLKIRSTLGAAANDAILEVSSDGATVKKINKNELSKTYVSIRRLESEELTKLVFSYKQNASSPLQVAGDDTLRGPSYSSDELPLRTKIY
jgi:hypothetical protein